MSRDAADRLRSEMLSAPDSFDEEALPPRFVETRAILREALSWIDKRGIDQPTLVAVMMSELLPRMVHEHGPQWTAVMLAKLSTSLAEGDVPGTTRQ